MCRPWLQSPVSSCSDTYTALMLYSMAASVSATKSGSPRTSNAGSPRTSNASSNAPTSQKQHSLWDGDQPLFSPSATIPNCLTVARGPLVVRRLLTPVCCLLSAVRYLAVCYSPLGIAQAPLPASRCLPPAASLLLPSTLSLRRSPLATRVQHVFPRCPRSHAPFLSNSSSPPSSSSHARAHHTLLRCPFQRPFRF